MTLTFTPAHLEAMQQTGSWITAIGTVVAAICIAIPLVQWAARRFGPRGG